MVPTVLPVGMRKATTAEWLYLSCGGFLLRGSLLLVSLPLSSPVVRTLTWEMQVHIPVCLLWSRAMNPGLPQCRGPAPGPEDALGVGGQVSLSISPLQAIPVWMNNYIFMEPERVRLTL